MRKASRILKYLGIFVMFIPLLFENIKGEHAFSASLILFFWAILLLETIVDKEDGGE